MPTIALKSKAVNISRSDLGHCWKKRIYIHVLWWGSGINGQPQSTGPDLDLNTFKVQECSCPGSWFKAISRLHRPVWCSCCSTCLTGRATTGIPSSQASRWGEYELQKVTQYLPRLVAILLPPFLQRKFILYFVWIQTNTQRKVWVFASPAIRWESALWDVERCWLQRSLVRKSPSLFAVGTFKIKFCLRQKVGILWRIRCIHLPCCVRRAGWWHCSWCAVWVKQDSDGAWGWWWRHCHFMAPLLALVHVAHTAAHRLPWGSF